MSGPEIRADQLTGLPTILAPARADRPFEFASDGASSASLPGAPGAKLRDGCPFCEGNEEKTPPELWADRPGGGDSGEPGWRVRSVPNLYPALAEPAESDGVSAGGVADADPLRASARSGEPDMFNGAPASGAHEVIVHSPRHVTSLAELDEGELGSAVEGWRERMRSYSEAAYTQLIVNEGPQAGASLEHSHAQLYALDFVPILVARERERASAYNQRTAGGQLLSDIAAEEVRRRERLVAIDDEAMLICPWASRSPFELRIVPRAPSASFERDGEVGTPMIATALRALAARFGQTPQYNLWVRTAPRGAEVFDWHIDISPRLAVRAGFELSTGVDINVYPPERAASELREALG